MAVNKVFPRVLSKSKDTRVRKKTEMIDALNVRASESLDAFKNGLDQEGEAGNEISSSKHGGYQARLGKHHSRSRGRR